MFVPRVADKLMHFYFYAPRHKIHLLFGGQDSPLVWWTSFTPRVAGKLMHLHLLCTSGQDSPRVLWTRFTSCVMDKFRTSCGGQACALSFFVHLGSTAWQQTNVMYFLLCCPSSSYFAPDQCCNVFLALCPRSSFLLRFVTRFVICDFSLCSRWVRLAPQKLNRPVCAPTRLNSWRNYCYFQLFSLYYTLTPRLQWLCESSYVAPYQRGVGVRDRS
jgi:hypothetical protein